MSLQSFGGKKLKLLSYSRANAEIYKSSLIISIFAEKALRKGVYNVEAKLTVFICFKENEEYLIKEIPLVGVVGSCKLDILDTQFPLSLRPRIGRVISLKNSGSISVSATVDIVQSVENQSECRDFFICPNNIVLNSSEKVALQISYKPENKKTDVER